MRHRRAAELVRRHVAQDPRSEELYTVYEVAVTHVALPCCEIESASSTSWSSSTETVEAEASLASSSSSSSASAAPLASSSSSSSSAAAAAAATTTTTVAASATTSGALRRENEENHIENRSAESKSADGAHDLCASATALSLREIVDPKQQQQQQLHKPACKLSRSSSSSVSSGGCSSAGALPVRATAHADTLADASARPVSWRIFRRYSDFRALYQELAAANPREAKLPHFPPRKFLGSSMNPDFVNARQAALDTWLRAVVDACPRLEGARLVDRFLMPAADAFHNVVIVDDGRRSEEEKESGSLDGGEAQKRKQFVHETTINDPLRFTDGPFGARFLGMAHHLRHAKLREEQRMENLKAKAREGGDAEDNLETLRRVNTGDFESLRVIGKGSFGKVVVARHKKSKEIYAVKILEKANICKRKQIEHTKTERRVMARVHHPFIVELHYAFQSRTRLYMVLEFVQGGELFHHLGKFKSFPEDWARMWTAEIVLALQYLHEQHIMFRDLKPENILFDKDGHVKLIDFGLCKEGITDGATGATSFCGTPEYLAPEILNRVGHGTAVDFWSLGMVLHEMLTGLPPWYSRNKRRLFDRIRNAALEFPRSVSAPARNLIAGLLVRDPRQRLGNRGTGVMEIRTHPFFRGIDWVALLQRKVVAPFRPSISTSSDGKPDTSNFDAAFTGMPLNDLESSGGGSGDITAPLGSDAASLPKDLCDNWILVGTES